MKMVKTEGGHKKGSHSRWCERAEAKNLCRKARRANDKKAVKETY